MVEQVIHNIRVFSHPEREREPEDERITGSEVNIITCETNLSVKCQENFKIFSKQTGRDRGTEAWNMLGKNGWTGQHTSAVVGLFRELWRPGAN